MKPSPESHEAKINYTRKPTDGRALRELLHAGGFIPSPKNSKQKAS